MQFEAYWRLGEEMIEHASKDQLAYALRILSMQSAHYARTYGELPLPDLTELLATESLDDNRLNLLKDGAIALVGILGSEALGQLDEDSSPLH